MATNAAGSTSVAATTSMALQQSITVLVVDENAQSLTLVVNLLKCCRYNVTTATNASEALNLLSHCIGEQRINLVMVDSYLKQDMDAFKFLRIIALELNLPAVMMVHEGEMIHQFVSMGIQYGACACLLCPIRLEEIQILWQHVLIRRNNSVKSYQQKPTMQTNLQQKKHGEQIKETRPPQKKQRLNWSNKPSLEKKFILAVEQLGINEATPSKILELMDDKDLTRENVSSHLQKYKLRLKKEKEVEQSKMTDPVSNLQETSPSNSVQLVQQNKLTNTPTSLPLEQECNLEEEALSDEQLRNSLAQLPLPEKELEDFFWNRESFSFEELMNVPNQPLPQQEDGRPLQKQLVG